MPKRIVSILLVLLLLPTLSGCWDAEEINELGFVLCVAVDKDGDGYKVTAQIAKSETYSKTPSGSGNQVNEKPFWVISATGQTVFEAIRNMAAISPRRIFWAHIKVIIIGEDLARSDIHDLLDFFTRNPELRFRTLVAVSQGEAGGLLEIVPMMEKDPATHLENIIENKSLTGKGYGNMLKNFLEEYLEPNGNPVTSRIILNKTEDNPILELNGSAVFHKSHMVGWLEGRETRGLLWVKNEIRDTIMVINCAYDDNPITVELKSGKTSIQSRIVKGIPYYEIKVEANGIIVEQGCATDFTDTKALHELEGTLVSAIQNDIQSTIIAAQNFGVDFLGLNEILHRQHPEEWKQLSENWAQILPETKFEISVKADIPSVSVLAKPLAPAKTVR